MKILYGVQGTGNGHLTRARCIGNAFAEKNVDIEYLFSGRDPDKYFSMDLFEKRSFKTGFTFATKNNRIDHIGTVRGLNVPRFIKDVKQIDINQYDLVITDYEPITAWRAKVSGAPVIGIGHQYAFRSKAPRSKADLAGNLLLKYFAPAKHALGVHWHHFGGSVLPPIIDTTLTRSNILPNYYVVYLPFDDSRRIVRLLKNIPDAQFVVYSPHVNTCSRHENVTLRKTQQEAFKEDLAKASGVITSCGFGLVSEALHVGLPLLAVPVAGQIEQLANAEALKLLGLASTVPSLTLDNISTFINDRSHTAKQNYPDVAAALVNHLLSDDWQNTNKLVQQMWSQVENHPQLPGMASASLS